MAGNRRGRGKGKAREEAVVAVWRRRVEKEMLKLESVKMKTREAKKEEMERKGIGEVRS